MTTSFFVGRSLVIRRAPPRNFDAFQRAARFPPAMIAWTGSEACRRSAAFRPTRGRRAAVCPRPSIRPPFLRLGDDVDGDRDPFLLAVPGRACGGLRSTSPDVSPGASLSIGRVAGLMASVRRDCHFERTGIGLATSGTERRMVAQSAAAFSPRRRARGIRYCGHVTPVTAAIDAYLDHLRRAARGPRAEGYSATSGARGVRDIARRRSRCSRDPISGIRSSAAQSRAVATLGCARRRHRARAVSFVIDRRLERN
jgi:hypothetical protein